MNIENIIRLRSLNQEDLAETTGLSQSTISRAAQGAGSVTLRQFRKIAEALKVPLAEIFQDDRTRSENELIEMYRRLPPERQVLWLEMSRTFARNPSLPS